MATLSDRAKRRIVLRSTAAFPKRLRVKARYRLLANLEVAKAERASSIIIGHPKSGNTWLRTMIARAYQVKYGLPATVALKTDELARADARIPRFCVSNGYYSYESELGRRLSGPQADAELLKKPAILLIRHPADIAVSWYIQFTKRVSPAKRELINASMAHPIDKDTISRWDFVMESEIGLACIIDFLNGWERSLEQFERPLIIRYEELRSSPFETLKKVSEHIGAPFTEHELQEAVDFGSFDNLRKLEASGFFKYGGMARRKLGGPETFKVRRGKVGGFRDDFSPEEVRAIDEMVAQRLSPSLGYVMSPAANAGAGVLDAAC